MDNKVRIFCDGFMSVYLGRNKKHFTNGGSVCVVRDNKIIYLKRNRIKIYKLPYQLALFSNPDSKEFVFTNNVAEYFALYTAIPVAKQYGSSIIYSDSQTIVNQVNGLYRVNAENLKIWNRYVRKSLRGTNIKVFWIGRKKIIKLIGH